MKRQEVTAETAGGGAGRYRRTPYEIAPKALKILHVITDLKTGGVPLHLLRLARYLKAQGENISVISLSPPGPVSELLAQANVPVQACDAAGWWDWRAFPRLASAVRDFAPDVVHSLLFHANIAARVACMLSAFDRHRLICEVQTVEIERTWHLTVDRLTQGLCRWIVGNSPSVTEHLARRGGISRARLRLVWGGVDAEAVSAAEPIDRAELGIETADPLLLWVGRLDPIKGLDVLLKATALVCRQRPVALAIVGGGPLAEQLPGWIEEQGLGGRVHLLGPRSDVPRLLKAADLFVFPSRTEGLPNAVLEAMAAGLPVVATDAPGCRDLIDDGRTGLLVPVDDPVALSAAIQRLLADRELAAQYAAAAADHASRNFNLAKCFEAYRAIYREAITSG